MLPDVICLHTVYPLKLLQGKSHPSDTPIGKPTSKQNPGGAAVSLHPASPIFLHLTQPSPHRTLSSVVLQLLRSAPHQALPMTHTTQELCRPCRRDAHHIPLSAAAGTAQPQKLLGLVQAALGPTLLTSG